MTTFLLVQRKKQDGVILVVALLFLVTITLLTVASMRSSNIGLQMVQNEESQIVAVQGAQALADAIVSDPGTTPVIGLSGYTYCTSAAYGCDQTDLSVDNEILSVAIAANELSARVERTGLSFRPPPRIVESSIDKFSSASFEVTTIYDRSDELLGRRQITEGVLVLVPAF